MSVGFHGFDHVHLFGERATHPITPPSGALSKGAGAPLEPRRLPLPAYPMTAKLGCVQLPFLG
ncbi:MAG: hypothetical protein LBE78_01910 [Burkholderiaceae bacterium]|nr:hypothetical protein [Burkholderiaceae bacterium]